MANFEAAELKVIITDPGGGAGGAAPSGPGAAGPGPTGVPAGNWWHPPVAPPPTTPPVPQTPHATLPQHPTTGTPVGVPQPPKPPPGPTPAQQRAAQRRANLHAAGSAVGLGGAMGATSGVGLALALKDAVVSGMQSFGARTRELAEFGGNANQSKVEIELIRMRQLMESDARNGKAIGDMAVEWAKFEATMQTLADDLKKSAAELLTPAMKAINSFIGANKDNGANDINDTFDIFAFMGKGNEHAAEKIDVARRERARKPGPIFDALDLAKPVIPRLGMK